MAKKSQKRVVRSEKEQFGCMGGIISIFDFRQGRSTQKLLQDRKHGSKHFVGAGNEGNKLETSNSPSETCQGNLGEAIKPSVKKLLEEEMSAKNVPKVENDVEAKENGSGNVKKSKKRAKKSRKNSCDEIVVENVVSEGSCDHKLEHSVDINSLMEELCRQIHQKSVGCGNHEVEMEIDRRSPGFEEKLNEAVKFLVSQKLKDGSVQVENGEIQTSKDLLNALQILSSDEELFLKLLRDPNSLLEKDVQDSPDANLGSSKADISEEKLISSRNRRYRNFFRRKVKSRVRNTLNGSKFSQNPDRIVILKPGKTAPEKESSVGLSGKIGSHYFFSEIKRKLKHVIGIEQHKASQSSVFDRSFIEHHQSPRRSFGVKDYAGTMSSPTKDHFFLERIARPYSSRLRDTETNAERGTVDSSKQKPSSLYIEAKKHLSEILSNEEQNADSSSRKVQKPLGRYLSLPDYNSSRAGSPRKSTENSQIIGIEAQDRDLTVPEKFDAVDVVIEAETVIEEESVQLDANPETSSYKNVEIIEVSDEKQDTECSKQTPEEDESLSALSPLPSPPHSKNVENPDRVTDIQHHSSPVSVLDPLPEDIVSPSSTKSHSDETTIQPLRIQFEEHSSSYAKSSMDDKELLSEYITAVMKFSSLNQDELYIKSHSSNHLLDSNLLEQVEFYPNQLCHDRKLLLNCINEVLLEIYAHYIGSGSSQCMKHTVREVCNRVHWHLLPLPLPRTLDQIVRKDMGKPGTWLDLRDDVESIGVEMSDAILDDLIEDIVNSRSS